MPAVVSPPQNPHGPFAFIAIAALVAVWIAIFIVVCIGCDVPQDGGCPDGRCPREASP